LNIPTHHGVHGRSTPTLAHVRMHTQAHMPSRTCARPFAAAAAAALVLRQAIRGVCACIPFPSSLGRLRASSPAQVPSAGSTSERFAALQSFVASFAQNSPSPVIAVLPEECNLPRFEMPPAIAWPINPACRKSLRWLLAWQVAAAAKNEWRDALARCWADARKKLQGAARNKPHEETNVSTHTLSHALSHA
jgi:hypothetical protein